MENLSTKVTEQDRTNAWRGVNGILYSEDRKRLLAVSETDISRYKIREGTKVICDFAFNACRYLEEIVIPNSVVRLGNRAFSGCCFNLKEIVIPDSVIEIGEEAFSGCSNLKSIQLPQHVKKISKNCFASCESIESIIIPNEVQEIEEFSFFLCKKLASITFTNTIRKIGESVFYGCENLKTIIIPIGTKRQFEMLLPEYKDKLVEQENGWTLIKARYFDAEEIAAVARAEVVPSSPGKSVCFFMMAGGNTYIPLIESSKLTVGDTLDLTKAQIITLGKGKIEITRIMEISSTDYDEILNLKEQQLHTIKNDNNHIQFLDPHQYDLTRIKPDAELITRYLNNNFQKYLYHFTHKNNLEQIKEMGGLYSWVQLEKMGKPCQYPGGDALSRELDTKYGVADYVHLSFSYKHPMAFRNERDMVILFIHPIVCLLPDTLFCNMNATDKNHKMGPTYKDLVNINLWTPKMGYLNSGTRLFKEKQAEVLVKSHIPLDYIVNIHLFSK